ncbi:DALR anticodon-binding domain-containing protein, partial [Pseudomonadota bacterium]
ANKRASNILRQAGEKGEQPSAAVSASLLQEATEKALFERVSSVAEAVKPALEKFDYTAALQEMAALRESVDAFFDEVMVMAEDDAVRLNRLALLNTLRSLFLQVADVSKLQS